MDNKDIRFTINLTSGNASEQIAQLQAQIDKLRKQNMNIPMDTKGIEGYSQALRRLQSEAEVMHRTFAKTGDTTALQQFNALVPQIKDLQTQQNKYNALLGQTNGLMDRLKNHAEFFATAGILAGVVGAPLEALNRLKELDSAAAGMLQVSPQLFDEDHVKNQAAVNAMMKDFIGLAEQYGAKVDDCFEATKLWGRGYKDLNTVAALTSQSMKLAIADSMDVQKANNAVEGIISSYQQYSNAVQFASRVTDVFTSLAHNTQVSAKDLSEALLRSSASAHVAGVEFEALSAMAAAAIKNTGLGGAQIGNMLKSVFVSIRSDKAVEALQKFGIESYRVGADGSKAFRPIVDVLNEVQIKTQGTNKDVQSLFLALSGGKFQSSKMAAMLGSYGDFVKNYTLAITASGMTDKQVAYQLDTIAKKIEQVRSAFDGLVAGMGSSGLTQYIKSWLDSTRAFIHGLQGISPEVYQTVGTMGKFAVEIYLVSTAVNFLSTGFQRLSLSLVPATGAIAAEGLAAGTAAVETGALAGAATVLSGGLNILLAALVAAGVGMTGYAMYTGQAEAAMDNVLTKQQNLLQAKQEELDNIPKQTQWIQTLCDNYTALSAQLVNVAGEEERARIVKENMGTTIEQLKVLIGEEGVARLEASNMSQDAINAEMTAHSAKTQQVTEEIAEIKKAIAVHTQAAIDAAEARVTSLQNEMSALSVYHQVLEATLEDCAALWDAYVGIQKKVFNMLPEGGLKSNLAKTIDDNVNFRETIRNRAYSGRKEEIEEAKYQLALLKQKQLAASQNSTAYTGGGKIGGDDVDETGKAHKGKRSGDKAAQAAERVWLSRDFDHLMEQAKQSADAYSESMEIADMKTQLFGESQATVANKLAMMKQRLQELHSQADAQRSLKAGYDGKVDSFVAGNADIQEAMKEQGVQWSDLSNEQQRKLLQTYAAQEKTIGRLLDLSDKLKTSIAQTGKEWTKLNSDKTREEYTAPKSLYGQAMSRRQTQESIGVAELGYKADPELKRLVELKAATDQLVLAQAELKRLESLPEKNLDDIQKQKLAVDQLKNKVQELANTYKDKLSESYAAMTEDILLNSKKLSDILGSEIRKLASDAIKSMFGIKQAQNSMFGQMAMGKGGGKGAASGAGATGLSIPSASTGGVGFLAMADGGVVDEPTHILSGEAGEEAFINMSKNDDRQKGILAYANAKMGSPLTKPVEYTPYFKNPNLGAAQVSIQVQQQEHIRLLEQQVQIQTATLEHLLNSSQGGGNVIIAGGGTSDQQILEAIKRNPDAINAMNGRRRGSGFR